MELGHPVINRTEKSIKQRLFWPDMRQHITQHVSCCSICQKNKRIHKKDGHLPPKTAESHPWEKLCGYVIGPHTIPQQNRRILECKCVTMIDPATGWFEIHPYNDKRFMTCPAEDDYEKLGRFLSYLNHD